MEKDPAVRKKQIQDFQDAIMGAIPFTDWQNGVPYPMPTPMPTDAHPPRFPDLILEVDKNPRPGHMGWYSNAYDTVRIKQSDESRCITIEIERFGELAFDNEQRYRLSHIIDYQMLRATTSYDRLMEHILAKIEHALLMEGVAPLMDCEKRFLYTVMERIRPIPEGWRPT